MIRDDGHVIHFNNPKVQVGNGRGRDRYKLIKRVTGLAKTSSVNVLAYLTSLFFVRDVIHSVADYNSTLIGVVVVVVVRIFTMG